MAWQTPLFKVAVFSLTLSLELAIAAGFASPARSSALDFSPPDRGAPETAVGGATRGNGLCGEVKPLVPKDTSQNSEPFPYFGITIADRPTLFFHVKGSPRYVGQPTYFALNEITTQGERGELVYEADLSLPERGGVMSVSLPPTLTLEEGKSYEWFMEMSCIDNEEASEMNHIQGWLDRISATPGLSDRLDIAQTPTDRATVYAEAGIWFDALETLARERRVENTPELQAAWASLLGDSDVGLNDEDLEQVVEASWVD
ncbi:DUF928 domain-containing protein [Oscillatoriales cyanobacterium LEGE 11467]|uniref:DUF928 domain-containing protein n=1 Tax=Zarconia navalis LEGE 11467 TaxID=1828826 RepID=A0A928VW81_9CYAN|nr:DUF928 domain-containing protein [Zarconia navalis]MBE9039283.1 DUF928 domain-containing protein [Zarconia navalis LEGE 11467]